MVQCLLLPRAFMLNLNLGGPVGGLVENTMGSGADALLNGPAGLDSLIGMSQQITGALEGLAGRLTSDPFGTGASVAQAPGALPDPGLAPAALGQPTAAPAPTPGLDQGQDVQQLLEQLFQVVQAIGAQDQGAAEGLLAGLSDGLLQALQQTSGG